VNLLHKKPSKYLVFLLVKNDAGAVTITPGLTIEKVKFLPTALKKIFSFSNSW